MTTPDAQKDIHDTVMLLLDCIKRENALPVTHPELREANRWLYEQLVNYKGMLRKRPATGCYEFLTPPADDGRRAGWYWRHPKHKPNDWVNWHGPYSSHKEAVAARVGTAKRSGAPVTSSDMLDQMLGL